jgi:hypothetical protein
LALIFKGSYFVYRQLAELQELLQEEQSKATNLEKKLIALRR